MKNDAAIVLARALWRHFRQNYTHRSMAEGIVEVMLMPDGEKRRVLMKGQQALAPKAARSQYIYDELVKAAHDLMTSDQWLLTPIWLRQFAADVHAGRLPRPTRRGPRLDERIRFRDVELGIMVDAVKERFCIPVYSNGEMKGPTAAGIVAGALKLESVNIPLSTIIRAWKNIQG
jgi:hypothetical protein